MQNDDDVQADYTANQGQPAKPVEKPHALAAQGAGVTDMDFINGAATRDWAAFQQGIADGKSAKRSK